jgi:hypothetical protein
MFEPVTMTRSVSDIAVPLASTGVVAAGDQDGFCANAIEESRNRIVIDEIISRPTQAFDLRPFLRFVSDAAPQSSSAWPTFDFELDRQIASRQQADVEQKDLASIMLAPALAKRDLRRAMASFLRLIPESEDCCGLDPRSDRFAAVLG